MYLKTKGAQIATRLGFAVALPNIKNGPVQNVTISLFQYFSIKKEKKNCQFFYNGGLYFDMHCPKYPSHLSSIQITISKYRHFLSHFSFLSVKQTANTLSITRLFFSLVHGVSEAPRSLPL